MNTKEIWVNEFTKRGLKVPDLINEMQPVVYEDNITSIAALEPAPPDPIINTSVEIVFISIYITL